MAFDGITVANIVKELQDSLTGSRISKIVQPESDELLLTIKTNTGQKRLFISADASLPLNKDVILASWTRTAEVEQTIGVPFLCELPVLKYIFGTTTKNKETIRCITVVRAVPVVYNENMTPGTIADFNEISKK